MFEAWRRLDGDRFIALFTEDARYEFPLFSETLVGRQEIYDVIVPGMADVQECGFKILRIVEAGDTGMAEAQFRSRLVGGQGRIDFDFAMVAELRDGRIARLAHYLDTLPLVSAGKRHSARSRVRAPAEAIGD
jgi:ketosteroid isomerase-like protein